MKNKYIYRSWISEKKFREILKYFAQDIEATKIANLTGISRISVNKILKNIRILMASECEKISKFSGEISSLQARLEASLWDWRKLLLLRFARNCEQNGMLKRDGKVYTQIVKNCSASELIPILSEFLKKSASY